MQELNDTAPESNPTLPMLPGVGKLLSNSWDLVKKRFKLFFTLAAAPAVLTFVNQMLMENIGGSYLLISILVSLVTAIIGIFVSLAIIKAMDDDKIEEPMQAVNESKRYFWSSLWVGLLVVLVTIIGFVLLIIPGIYLSIALNFFMYVIILENKKGWSTAERSMELVKGRWWAVFGRSLAFAIIVIIPMGIIAGIAGALNSAILVSLVTIVLTTIMVPFSVAYEYLIYKALLKEKPVKME